MNLDKLGKVLEDEPRFRYKQINDGVYVRFVEGWSEISNIPKLLVERLNEKCSLEIDGQILETSIRADKKASGTLKALIKLVDGSEIETVLMMHKDGRNTVCVSSQVGCPMACSFCATGDMGYKRNLTSAEIVEQVLFFSRYLKHNFNGERSVTNVVFMGMGEPFLNYENVWKSIAILNDNDKFNIGARKISISTVGVVEGIRKMAKENLQINLAISLHAASESLRTLLIPNNKSNSIKKIMLAVDNYLEKTNRQVMFEYMMIDGVNDTLSSAKELSKILKNPLYIVNLIKYNNTGKYSPSSSKRVEFFKKTLEGFGIRVSERYNYGGDIDAACGQLARNLKQ